MRTLGTTSPTARPRAVEEDEPTTKVESPRESAYGNRCRLGSLSRARLRLRPTMIVREGPLSV
jgi:hypothetical protein